MKTSINAFLKFIWSNLGYCPRCMRKSFTFAMASILIAVAGSFCLPRSAIVPISLCAIALTALWLAHITAYSLKTLARRSELSPHDSLRTSRRKLFAAFAKISVAIAVSSMVPRMAAAQGSPNCGSVDPHCSGFNCPDGSVCCGGVYDPKLGCVNMRCEPFCQGQKNFVPETIEKKR